MLVYERARAEEAKALARVSWKAFDNDVHYGAPGPGGPEGYKSEVWQSTMMKRGKYFKIVQEGKLIGGFLLFRKGPDHYELARIFLHPDVQNQGLGTQIMHYLLDEAFPEVRRWTLGTPTWNSRTQHFYQKFGFIRVKSERRGVRYELKRPRERPTATAPGQD
jgi:RimJ/RimL family protein N-acetyltransferase